MVVHDLILGLEACLAEPPAILQNRKFGLLMNRASVDHRLRLACDLLCDEFPGCLRSIFTPQHGLWGDAQANMIETPDAWHTRLGIPIHSLYSNTRRPTHSMLDDLDCLVIDLQDVGTRVYTFIWTVLQCLQACAECGVSVLILDRPNPIGGRIVEGRMLEPSFKSFVGGAAIPMRHGLTLGELANFVRREENIDVELSVVPLRGWRTESEFESYGRCWIPPSPNLPTIDSARVYPGQVLLEGTNLSEGRGTTTPFEVLGAPFLDPEQLAHELTQLRLPGVRFLPSCFQPNFDKWQGESCGGVSIHVTDIDKFRSFKTTIEAISHIRSRYGNDFDWLDPPYEYETVKPPIDIIYGGEPLRLGGATAEALCEVDLKDWGERSFDSQIYQRSERRFQA